MANLFDNNTLIVNQKFTVIANQYQIQDENGNEIGFVQENMSTGKKALSLLVSKKVMPFNLSILDSEKNVLATISRGVTLFLSKTSIKNANGEEIAKINQKFTMLKPKFEYFRSLQLGENLASVAYKSVGTYGFIPVYKVGWGEVS